LKIIIFIVLLSVQINVLQSNELFIPIDYKEALISKSELDFESYMPLLGILFDDSDKMYLRPISSDFLDVDCNIRVENDGSIITLNEKIPFNSYSHVKRFISEDVYKKYRSDYEYEFIKFPKRIDLKVFNKNGDLVKTQVFTSQYNDTIALSGYDNLKLEIIGNYTKDNDGSEFSIYYNDTVKSELYTNYKITTGYRSADFNGRKIPFNVVEFINSSGVTNKFALEVLDRGKILNFYSYVLDSNTHYKLKRLEFSLKFDEQ